MNKRREDFHTLEDYNDYLEEVEEIIYNLVFRINVSETVKRWEQFKAENHALIAKNQQLQVYSPFSSLILQFLSECFCRVPYCTIFVLLFVLCLFFSIFRAKRLDATGR